MHKEEPAQTAAKIEVASAEPRKRNRSSKSEKPKHLKFMSMMINPALLQNPADTKQSLSREVFNLKEIKSIVRRKDYLQIDLVEKRAIVEQEQDVLKTDKVKDPGLKTELHAISSSGFEKDYSLYRQRVNCEKWEEEFSSFVRARADKPILCFYIALRNSPKMQKLVLSKPLLEMIGYGLDEALNKFETFREQAIEFLGGAAYRELFLTFFQSFRMHMSAELNQDVTIEQILQQTTKTLINPMKGKKKIELEMELSNPKPFCLMLEGKRIISEGELGDEDQQLRAEKEEIFQQKAYKTLHKITKLPQFINPLNQKRICKYIELDASKMNGEEPIQQPDSGEMGSSPQSSLVGQSSASKSGKVSFKEEQVKSREGQIKSKEGQ